MLPEIRPQARIAGLLYLLIALLAPFSMLYVPSTLIVWGDAAFTAANILENEGIFRLSFLVDALVCSLEIALIALLYRLFLPVSSTLSLAAALFRLAMTVLMGVNLMNHVTALAAFHGGAVHTAHGMLSLQAHQSGVYLWQIFFACHCLILGILMFRSGWLPKVLGILVALGSLGYGLDSLRGLILPDAPGLPLAAGIFLSLSTIGELGLTFLLLIKVGAQRSR